MYRILALLLIVSVMVIGCAAEPTATPTPEPEPTAIPTLAPTEPPAAQPTSAPTVAPTDTPPPTATSAPVTGIVKSTLNVREQPTTRAALLGVLTKDDVVTLVGRTDDQSWLQINYPLGETTTAWVIAERIDTTANLATLPSTASASGTPAATSVAIATTTGVTATSAATVTTGAETPAATTAAGTPDAATTVTQTETVTGTVTAPETPAAPTTGGTPAGSIIFDTYENGTFNVYRVRADGTGLEQIIAGGSDPALSPDGGRIAYRMRRDIGGLGIALANSNGEYVSTITEESAAGYPTWSPDGSNLAYNVVPGNTRLPAQILRLPAGPGNEPTVVVDGWRPSWQPGAGALLAYDGCKGATDCGSVLSLGAFDGDPNNPTLVTNGQAAAWSPGGNQIAFQAFDENGLSQIWIANADGSDRRQVTTDVGTHGMPTWSSDGQWLFYRSDQGGAGWAIFAIRTNGTDARKIVDSNVHPDLWVYAKIAIGP